ncbi:MAG: vitamin B12-dependent ribonucleotide reductase, partial [Treponema sp.]|nr:vitamin B12-dependent ribonucleotide reductase [Treponema sp.]
TDLGQIKPEDLIATGTKNDMGQTEDDRPRRNEKTSAGFRPHGTTRGADQTGPAASNAPQSSAKAKGPESYEARNAGAHGARPAVAGPAEQSEALKIAQARIKGYEGDPCPACGSFTLVRNGTCMKCDTCGGTTGCS